MKKLISRTEFAKIANVTQGAVTRAAKTSLREAVDGKYIDLDHAAAQEFIKKNIRAKTPETLPGIDPLYEDAIQLCRDTGKWSANVIKQNMNVGSTRATKIFNQILAAGGREKFEREEKVLASVAEPKSAHARGTAAKRQQEMAADTGEIEESPIPPNIEIYADMTLREIYEKFGTATRFKDWLAAMKDITVIQERQLKAARLQGELVSRKAVHDFIVDPINSTHIKLLRDGSQTIAVRTKALVESGADVGELKKFIEETLTSFIRPMKSRVTRALENLKTDLYEDDESL